MTNEESDSIQKIFAKFNDIFLFRRRNFMSDKLYKHNISVKRGEVPS